MSLTTEFLTSTNTQTLEVILFNIVMNQAHFVATNIIYISVFSTIQANVCVTKKDAVTLGMPSVPFDHASFLANLYLYKRQQPLSKYSENSAETRLHLYCHLSRSLILI